MAVQDGDVIYSERLGIPGKHTLNQVKTYVKDGLVAADITDFDASVSNNPTVVSNSLKTTVNFLNTTATTGQTVIELGIAADNVVIFINGMFQTPTLDYSLTGSAVTMTYALNLNDSINIQIYT